MFKRITLVLAITVLVSAGLFADFSYEQTSKMTGGFLQKMAFLSKQLREPIRSTVAVKGDRMATVSPLTGHIIDLKNETITEINFQKKTYSVVTFAQLAEAVQQAQARLKAEQGGQQMDMTMKPSVKETGQTREINGAQAREMIMTVEFEGSNPENQERATLMTMVADMWIAPDVAGYAEVRDFYRRMAEKLGWMPGMSMMGGQNSGKAMAELYKEAAKLNGVPVLQITKMNMGGAAAQGEQAAGTPPPQQQPQPQVDATSAAGSAVGSRLGGRLGGLAGGLGGLGRRRQQQQQPPPEQTQTQPAAQGGEQQAAAGAGSLMEMTTELTGFSSAPVDASKFEVPAGFKQVDSEMLKGMRRR
jgi:hypothetical protein